MTVCTIDSWSLMPLSYSWDKDVFHKALPYKLMAADAWASASGSLDMKVSTPLRWEVACGPHNGIQFFLPIHGVTWRTESWFAEGPLSRELTVKLMPRGTLQDVGWRQQKHDSLDPRMTLWTRDFHCPMAQALHCAWEWPRLSHHVRSICNCSLPTLKHHLW